MKTRLLAMLLALLMTVSCLVACADTDEGTDPAVPSTTDKPTDKDDDTIFLGDDWVDNEVAPGATGKKHQKAESIPSHTTLIGTDFLPPIGNQGSIGSCASSSIAYCQFSNAVARYLYSLNPKSDFKPATGKSEYLISSKFTMNFSGAGTAWVYDILVDHGALTRSDSDFYRHSNGAATSGPVDNPYLESSSWDVEEGELAKALDVRLTNYEQIWMNTYNYQLTDTDKGKALVEKIKDAVVTGNVVVTGGFSSFWEYGPIDSDGLGSLGKEGDVAIIYSAEDGQPGGHQVSIVGYDDNITATVAGVTMKGAFQVANSWGDYWQNDGYVWLMYDAVNKVSQYKELRDKDLYTSKRLLSLGMDGPIVGRQIQSGANAVNLTLSKRGTTQIEGKTYNTYFINYNNAFLAYSDGTVTTSSRPNDNNALWALIPMKDAASMDGYTEYKDSKDFLGGYMLYAVNTDYYGKFLNGGGSGQGNYTPSLSSLSYTYNYSQVCFAIDGYKASEKTQTVRFLCHNGDGYETPRTFSMDQFCFIYWDSDLEYKKPGYTVTVEVEARNREGFYMELTRTDASGKTTTHVPALFHYGSAFLNTHPTGDYCSEGHYLNFKGEVDGKDCTGYFTLSYAPLLDEGASYDNYVWGINIVENGSLIKVKRITLKDESGNVLSEIKPTTAGGKYVFEFGNELESYRNIGTFHLQNASGEFLNPINYVLLTPGKQETAQGFEISYNYDTNEYTLKQADKIYILDIKGDEIKLGAMVKFNNYSPVRKTQTWRIIDNGDGSITIRLATNTKYAVGLKDGQVCLVAGADIAKYGKWTLHNGGKNENFFTVEKAGTGLKASFEKPDVAGSLSVTVTDGSGSTVAMETPKFDANGKATIELADLKPGSYVFTLTVNGKPSAEHIRCVYIIR